MPYKDKQDLYKAQKRYRVRKKEKLRQLFLQHYDWLTDSYIIPHKEVAQYV